MRQHPVYLFIHKAKHSYDGPSGSAPSSGVRSSVSFVVDMLQSQGINAVLAEAVDGDSIDALVTKYRPRRVVLEALWVTPEKLAELLKLHPGVHQWTVRAHSEIPFLAQEGCAVDWLTRIGHLGVEVAFNSAQTVEDWRVLGRSVWLPNYYPLRSPRMTEPSGDDFHIGCFGAIRPLKNQLIQALAAIKFARYMNRHLVFHMNGSRIEQFGESNLKNIRSAIYHGGAKLEMHPWLPHTEFLELVAQMDICLAVSLSESYCIVAADAVSMGVPLVGSSAISWLPRRSRARVDSVEDIFQAMDRTGDTTVHLNHEALENYLETAVETWMHWVKEN